MTMFSVRVSDNAARRFDAVAAPFGGRSAMLRRLIETAGGEAETVRKANASPRSLRLMVRLSPEDATAAGREADAMGLRPSAWVAALVRRRVCQRPTFSPLDEVELLAIHGEMRRIGVNVNQMARTWNAWVGQGRAPEGDLRRLEDMCAELRAHMSTLRQAFAGNLAYWQVTP